MVKLPNKQSCNLCGGGKFKLVKSFLRDDQAKFKVYACQQCGHVQLLPKPTDEDDKEFYDQNQQDKNRGKEIDYEKLAANQRFDTDRHVALIRKLFSRKISILDIGAGYGFFVASLYDAGYEKVKGLEISRERRVIAQAHTPAQILEHDVAAGAEIIGRYDVVTLFHVLEHTTDPVAFLKQIKALLKPKGTLICEVPNVEDQLLANSKEYHDFYWIRAHLNYFSGQTLKRAFTAAGFNKIKLVYAQRYGLLNLSNWLLYGKPQIERPVFEINREYAAVEDYYRELLERKGRSDALLAIARV
ncbi:MAG: methyltransferase domain-containing protein [Candidatus Margulisiibacteriota bacterium]